MTNVAPALAELGIAIRIGGSIEQRLPCPWCKKGERDDALGVNIDSGAYHCFRCNASGRVGSKSRGQPVQARRIDPPHVTADSDARLQLIWQRTLPLRETLGETYLRHRHCALPPPDSDLRFLPGNVRFPPALCALVTDSVTAEPISLHFTLLRADGRGKAGTDRDKLLLKGHRKAGGVIRLWPNEAVTYGVGVGEGIETCLAAAHAYTPVWACVDAGNLAKLPVLAGIDSLVIFGDADAAGVKAANECGQRWADAGRHVRLVVPEQGDIADAVAA